MSIKKENLKYVRKLKQTWPKPPFNHKWDKHLRHEQEAAPKKKITSN